MGGARREECLSPPPNLPLSQVQSVWALLLKWEANEQSQEGFGLLEAPSCPYGYIIGLVLFTPQVPQISQHRRLREEGKADGGSTQGD